MLAGWRYWKSTTSPELAYKKALHLPLAIRIDSHGRPGRRLLVAITPSPTSYNRRYAAIPEYPRQSIVSVLRGLSRPTAASGGLANRPVAILRERGISARVDVPAGRSTVNAMAALDESSNLGRGLDRLDQRVSLPRSPDDGGQRQADVWHSLYITDSYSRFRERAFHCPAPGSFRIPC
jgi:hypothetical protein